MKIQKEPTNWEQVAFKAVNDSFECSGDFNAKELMDDIENLPIEPLVRQALISRIEKLLFAHVSLINSVVLLLRKGKRVPMCPSCGKFYMAIRRTQQRCSACAKNLRQKAWRDRYEKEHGHPYRQKREAAYVKKVRKALENRKDFKPTLENKKDLAADVDITLKQCEAALEIIL